ncbi:hypothetical protein J4T87_0025795 (plasmid) [Rhizobium sp. T1473]|uniref:hypothetical protein n=1 Tax=Rhizobium sp. T1473 TaxID=555321 RepID=UPI001CD7F9EB|nr:hypothetical protein [Rhizobium sp. T1473]MCA0807487.1 hypothetical protein [Rhizobium sp. T1473]
MSAVNACGVPSDNVCHCGIAGVFPLCALENRSNGTVNYRPKHTRGVVQPVIAMRGRECAACFSLGLKKVLMPESSGTTR